MATTVSGVDRIIPGMPQSTPQKGQGQKDDDRVDIQAVALHARIDDRADHEADGLQRHHHHHGAPRAVELNQREQGRRRHPTRPPTIGM